MTDTITLPVQTTTERIGGAVSLSSVELREGDIVLMVDTPFRIQQLAPAANGAIRCVLEGRSGSTISLQLDTWASYTVIWREPGPARPNPIGERLRDRIANAITSGRIVSEPGNLDDVGKIVPRRTTDRAEVLTDLGPMCVVLMVDGTHDIDGHWDDESFLEVHTRGGVIGITRQHHEFGEIVDHLDLH